VAAAIEVLGAQPRLPHHRIDRRLRHHHRAEHRLLGLEAVGLQQRDGAAARPAFDRSVSARFHVRSDESTRGGVTRPLKGLFTGKSRSRAGIGTKRTQAVARSTGTSPG